jgi:hypothetical protein
VPEAYEEARRLAAGFADQVARGFEDLAPAAAG